MTPRRFYLLKAKAAAEACESALEAVWYAKQLAEPGTVIPNTFPFASALAVAHYVALEDLEDATTEELQRAGLTARQAAAVIAAL